MDETEDENSLKDGNIVKERDSVIKKLMFFRKGI